MNQVQFEPSKTKQYSICINVATFTVNNILIYSEVLLQPLRFYLPYSILPSTCCTCLSRITLDTFKPKLHYSQLTIPMCKDDIKSELLF